MGARGARVAIALLAAVASAGCGARWTDEQHEGVLARGRTTGGAASVRVAGQRTTGAAPAPVPAAALPTEGAAGPTTTTPAGAPGVPAGGPAVRACDAPSSAPGVTARAITLGTIATKSGPVPGLGSSAEAAVKAYVAYRNSRGGACGRKVELVAQDDGADSARFRSLVGEMGGRVLGFAGIFANGDGGGAELVERQRIPVVAAASTSQFQAVSTVFDINPPPPQDVRGAAARFRWLHGQGVRTASVITLSNSAAVAELDQQQRMMESAGIRVVDRQVLPVTTLSFDSAARGVANSGADYLFFLGAADHDAGMARSMRDSGYELKFEEYLTGYGSKYVDLAGPAADGTSSWIRSLPAEDGGANPEQAAFATWMDRVAPDQPADVFAADAWASTKAFLDALEQLPGPISREALVARLQAVRSFDAGGFIGDIDLGGETSKGCVVGMRVEGGTWRRMTPAQGFLC